MHGTGERLGRRHVLVPIASAVVLVAALMTSSASAATPLRRARPSFAAAPGYRAHQGLVHGTALHGAAPSSLAPLPPDPTPIAPGGAVSWGPAGRAVAGQPALYLGSWGGAGLAWMHPLLVRPVVVPGAGDPGGPWPWGGQVAPASQPLLVSAFNGGFKWGDFAGGVLTFGRSFRAPLDGVATFAVFADGTFTVGMWGRDLTAAQQPVAFRQNLQMLVDGGAPVPAAGNPGAWGGSVAGVATMRSGVGVDANGGLVWAGGRLSPLSLAQALVAGGAVRAMQMDINPDWVNFDTYDAAPDGVHGSTVYGAGGRDRYLRPDGRDFIAILVRGTVLPGSREKVGTGLHASLLLR
jgi:hypothetical protein